MRRILLVIFGVFIVVLGVTPVRAASLLTITVGSSTLTCDNSTATGVTTCTANGFTTSLGSNSILALSPITIGGYTIASANVVGNQPGTSTIANLQGNAFSITNVSATDNLVIDFAGNNYSLPAGTPLGLSASQAGTFTVGPSGDMEAFTGYGNAANTLAATGVADATPNCINPSAAPPESKCNTSGVPTTFARSGNFALAGHAVITMAIGSTETFSQTVASTVPPLTAACVSQATGQVGVPYDSFITVNGGVAPFTFTLNSGSFPPGLGINASTGEISGTPTTAGSYPFTVKVTDSSGGSANTAVTPSCGITIVPPNLAAGCVAQGTGQVNVFYSSFIQATGGTSPYTFTLNSGSFPPGLNINASTGQISGTPTAAGTFSFTVKVVDSTGGTALVAITPNCGITIAPPPSANCVSVTAVQGVAITPVSFTGTGGAGGPYTFSAIGLPPNLSLSSGGTLSGTPTVSGTFNYTVTVTDKNGNSGTVNCSVVVSPPPSTPLAPGDAATIGFWHNKNGQALINSFNGGSSSTLLGNWLATNFPNLYGASSPNNLAGETNSQVATFYLTAFGNVGGVQGNTYAQVMSTALAVYATDINLGGGSAAASYGFHVSSTGTGAKLFNVGNNGAAAGVANNTSLSVLQLLQIANANFNGSTSLFYGGDQTLTSELNNIFNGINQGGDI